MRKPNIKPLFTFNGKTNSEMGVELLSMPTRFIAGRNGTKATVSGRDGFLWFDEDSFAPNTIKIQVMIPDPLDIDAAAAWLREDGLLIFSDEPSRAWKCKGIKEISRDNKDARLHGQIITIIWDAQPFRYEYPQPDNVILTESGRIVNEGTVKAKPIIKITCTGAFDNLVINGTQIAYDGSESVAIIDCDAMETLTEDGSVLLNSHFSMDEFPTLRVGTNFVSWVESTITSVEFTRPWRFL